MKIKKNDDRKISTKFIKKKIRLKLNDCVIKNNFLWIKNRLYISKNSTLRIDIIKHIHDSLQKKHVDRIIIYQRLNTHYYWQNMINFVFKYVKTCQHCKRIKIYRHVKYDFFKFLLIFERYFQKIIVNFIIFLFVCKRNDRNYRHIMIMIDRLSKIKRFVILKFLNVDVVMQTFIDWI